MKGTGLWSLPPETRPAMVDLLGKQPELRGIGVADVVAEAVGA